MFIKTSWFFPSEGVIVHRHTVLGLMTGQSGRYVTEI